MYVFMQYVSNKGHIELFFLRRPVFFASRKVMRVMRYATFEDILYKDFIIFNRFFPTRSEVLPRIFV